MALVTRKYKAKGSLGRCDNEASAAPPLRTMTPDSTITRKSEPYVAAYYEDIGSLWNKWQRRRFRSKETNKQICRTVSKNSSHVVEGWGLKGGPIG